MGCRHRGTRAGFTHTAHDESGIAGCFTGEAFVNTNDSSSQGGGLDEQSPTLPAFSSHSAQESVRAVEEHRFPTIPNYNIVGCLGRGGAGVVYQAWQVNLKRYVALKMLREDALANEDQRERFRGEAEAVARLRHAHIVQIFEVGEYEGRPYLALEYVAGGSLAERLVKCPMALSEAVNLVETAARAMQAAHEAGIIHRDLTPANILLADDGSPLVTDFGLAKRLDSDTERTLSGVIFGTPAYMAPEQASGQSNRVSAATDVYALGTILYELLTGRPPFRTPCPLETMNCIVSQEPRAPRSLDSRTPRDLEIICLKCLRKEAGQRYASAGELADDLQRWRNGEPIQARSVPRWVRVVKWTRRRPAAAALLGVLVLAALSASLGGLWHTLKLEQALRYAQDQESEARREHRRALEREEALDEQLHALDVHTAQRLWRSGHLTQAVLRLEKHFPAGGEIESATFDWRYQWRLCRTDASVLLLSPGAEALSAAFSPDGMRLAVAHSDGSVAVWSMATHRRIAHLRRHRGAISQLAFAPDGRTLWTKGEDGALIWWDVAHGAEVRCRKQRNVSERLWLPSPNGQLLAIGLDDKAVALRRFEGEKQLWQSSMPARVEQLAFAADSSVLASTSQGGWVKVWTADGGEAGWFAHDSAVTALALSCKGGLLAVAESDGQITLHVRNSGHTVRFHSSREGVVRSLAFSPDRSLLASIGDDHIIRIWETSTGRLRNALRGHTDRINGLTFAPDSRSLATVGRDGVVRLWNPLRRQDRQPLLEPTPSISRLAWSPDGRIAAAAGSDRVVTLWDAGTWQTIGRLTGHFDEVRAMAFAPDSRTLATASADRVVQLWDVPSQSARSGLVHRTGVRAVVFSGDGKTLATGEDNGTLALWDVQHGVRLTELARHRGAVTCLARSPDGNMLASAGDDRTVQLWLTERWQRGPTLVHPESVAQVDFHADSRTLATVQTSGTVMLWDAVAGTLLVTMPRTQDAPELAHFSPDGRSLVLASRISPLTIWDINDRRNPSIRYHLKDGNEVVDVAFAPKGKAFVSAHRDGRITRWDLRGGVRRTPCGPICGPVLGLEICANGETLAALIGIPDPWMRHTYSLWGSPELQTDSWLAGDSDESLRFWHVASGKSCRPLSTHSAVTRPSLIAAAPNGRTLAAAQADGAIALWDVTTGKCRAILTISHDTDWHRMGQVLVLAGLPAHSNRMAPVRALAFAPDSRTLSVRAADGTLQLWDVERAERRAVLPGNDRDSTCLTFAPDGQTLATSQADTVELWDIQTDKCRRKTLHPGSRILCLAFSSDGRSLVSGASDSSVKLWDLQSERETPLSGHTDNVSVARFSPDGKTLATGSFDRTVRLWDVATAQEVLRLEGHSGPVHCLVFTPDGRNLISGGETPHGSGEMYLWPATVEAK